MMSVFGFWSAGRLVHRNRKTPPTHRRKNRLERLSLKALMDPSQLAACIRENPHELAGWNKPNRWPMLRSIPVSKPANPNRSLGPFAERIPLQVLSKKTKTFHFFPPDRGERVRGGVK